MQYDIKLLPRLESIRCKPITKPISHFDCPGGTFERMRNEVCYLVTFGELAPRPEDELFCNC